VFLLRQHKNRKHQFGRQHCLDKDTLWQARPGTECRPYIEWCWKEHADKVTREYAARNLCKQQHECAYRRDSLDQHHSESDSWVKQAARYTEEYPNVDHETEAEYQGDVQEDVGRETGSFSRRGAGL